MTIEAEKEYLQLIEKAIDRNIKWEPFKYEEHHIKPRCMGGTDVKSNLVLLTIKEHFRAHVLLADMYPDNYGLANACIRMIRSHQGKTLNLDEAAEEFEYLRIRAAKFISKLQKGRKKTNEEIENIRTSRLTAKSRSFSDEAKANMAEARRKTWEQRRANGTDKEIAAKTRATRIANGSYKIKTEAQLAQFKTMVLSREPWNKGKKGVISDETRQKMSLAKKGKPLVNKDSVGKEAWNKGKIGVSEETQAKMRASRLKYIENNANPAM